MKKGIHVSIHSPGNENKENNALMHMLLNIIINEPGETVVITPSGMVITLGKDAVGGKQSCL